jgi:hypothetical protein
MWSPILFKIKGDDKYENSIENGNWRYIEHNT